MIIFAVNDSILQWIKNKYTLRTKIENWKNIELFFVNILIKELFYFFITNKIFKKKKHYNLAAAYSAYKDIHLWILHVINIYLLYRAAL
jgi:hypothetical protein